MEATRGAWAGRHRNRALIRILSALAALATIANFVADALGAPSLDEACLRRYGATASATRTTARR